MATLEEGTYLVINYNSSLALDVKGASDKSGTNIIQYTVNKGDAQIWAVSKPEDGDWQFINSLSGKCMDVEALSSGKNVRQYNDNDDMQKQRWKVTDASATKTYSGKSYPAFYIRPAGSNSIGLYVANSNTSTSVVVNSSTTSNNAKWIFVPVSVFKAGYSYEIHLASDPNKVIGIASGSTANGARAIVQSDADSDNQMFYTEVDEEEFTVMFHALCSDKVLDVKGGTAENSVPVIQYTKNDGLNQKWLVVKNGTVKYSGTNYPTYEIRSQSASSYVMDCQGGSSAVSTNIIVYTRNGNINQRFFFVKTECYGSKISAPGALTPTTFKRNGSGTVRVRNLTFKSKASKFQARYKVRTYGVNKLTYTDSKWKALTDDSTARNGWGDAWEPTFTASPIDGVVSLPFDKTFTLDTTNRSIDVYIQVREYQNAYTLPINGTQIRAHGPVKQTTIKVRQTPTITVGTSYYDIVDGDLCFVCPLTLSSYEPELLKARLVSDTKDEAVTEWITRSGTAVVAIPMAAFKRFVTVADENLKLEFSLFTDEGVLVNGISGTLNGDYFEPYDSTRATTMMSVEEDADNKLAVVSTKANLISAFYDNNRLYIELTDALDGPRMVEFTDYVATVVNGNDYNIWNVPTPFNKSVRLVYFGSLTVSGHNYFVYDYITVKLNSHMSMWNWEEKTQVGVKQRCAGLIINPDSPPQQTRQFGSALKTILPAGRKYSVGFSGRGMSVNLNISGIVLDKDAEYVSSEAYPEIARVENIAELSTLSGRGIHPVYRTPYGDLYRVGISDVDVTKNALNYSTASVTQVALEE